MKASTKAERFCDVIARRELSSSLIYTWRKQLREGQLAAAVPLLPMFAAVQVAGPTPTSARAGAMFIGTPQDYIADVIAKVAGDWPVSRWNDLMPWDWMPTADQPIAQAACFAASTPRLRSFTRTR